MDDYVAACRGILNALKDELPNMADDFFANALSDTTYRIPYDNRTFAFSRSSMSSSSTLTHMGFEIALADYKVPRDASNTLSMWVVSPQSSNAANKKALTACVEDLIANVRNGKVVSTRDAKNYL